MNHKGVDSSLVPESNPSLLILDNIDDLPLLIGTI